MRRMVKCYVTRTAIDSNNAYKTGNNWFRNKDHVVSNKVKDKTVQNIIDNLKQI